MLAKTQKDSTAAPEWHAPSWRPSSVLFSLDSTRWKGADWFRYSVCANARPKAAAMVKRERTIFVAVYVRLRWSDDEQL